MAGEISRNEHVSAVFVTTVMQFTNMAAMFLGQAPNPETNQKVVDLDAAQFFIDQLEMLEVKTKGNLNPDEQNILKESLAAARMGFVQAVEASQKTAPAPSAAPAASAPAAAPAEPEERKKFTKKY
ncbi:MAG: DUF1844 domain-containing protein [Verrucomicrobia subdivision 3 bacterium]|nr:DUF1844 domain-containing protein [Limisphaerales bacterium]